MSDTNNKLEGLKARLGLLAAKDIVARPEPVRPLPAKPARPLSDKKSGRVLSDALAAQLRARLLIDTPQIVQHEGEDSPVAIETILPGITVGDEGYSFFLYRREFPLEHAVGDIPLADALACCGKEIALSACDESLLTFDPRTSCFMDTETTGLAGGAGTVAFLVGVGYFQGSNFVLEQCFLRDYDDEGAMLEYLAEKLGRFSTVVSYNGKSFDLPLLRSRFVQHRLDFPLEETSHYDLVHAARRVWKKRLNSCTLSNIEREVLGLHRQGDVPGYLIPQLWLNYLDSRDARPLAPVFYHHEMDILSLVALAGYLAQRLAKDNDVSFHHAEDRLSVVRLYVKNKEYDSAITAAQQFLESSQVKDDLRRECLALLGQSCKRTGLFEEMVAAWVLMHEEFPEDTHAAAELAKYREHQERNYTDAIKICKETLTRIEKNATPLDFSISALRGRLARLEKKQARLRARSEEKGAFFPEE